MVRTSGDFFDECDRMSNRAIWFNFCAAVWGDMRKYVVGRIKVIGSKVSQETVGGVGGKAANNAVMKRAFI